MTPLVPYPGGKRRVASLVWQALGDVPAYVEPFAGSLAVLLARPRLDTAWVEVVGDADGLVVNFHRAIAADPDGVLRAADHPTSDVDYTARIRACLDAAPDLVERLAADPRHYDSELAGWWAYAQSAAIARVWSSMPRRTWLPQLAGHVGVHAWRLNGTLRERVHALSRRLRGVTVLCRDALAVLEACEALMRRAPVGVFLDPPYQAVGGRGMYRLDEDGVEAAAWRWAVEHGDDPSWRIVVAGHEDGRELPPGWTVHEWARGGGWAVADGLAYEETTAALERLWFSPHCCSRGEQLDLLEDPR